MEIIKNTRYSENVLDKTQDMVYNDGAPLPLGEAVVVTCEKEYKDKNTRARLGKDVPLPVGLGQARRKYEAYKEKRRRGRLR